MFKTQCLLAFVALYVRLAHSWEFAVSVDDRLEFYINDTKTDTVRLESQNPLALAYDEVHDMLLYVDKQIGNDGICGYNISFAEYKCYMKSSGRDIQGLAFDPITQHLFFTDTKEKSINWISFQAGSKNNVNGNLLIKLDDGIPTDIAVDSCRGYIYWINTNLTTSTIERARFDGFDREVVIKARYKMDLHSLAIDQQTKKIYWFMPENRSVTHLCSADMNAENIHYHIIVTYENGTLKTHPNSLTVSKKNLLKVDFLSDRPLKNVLKYRKPSITMDSRSKYRHLINAEGGVGIVAYYKIAEQFEGIQECQHLTRLVPHNSLKSAGEYEGLFCVHGVKVHGQSLCKCTPGYTGERCDVSVCENYCMHGNCSFNDEGLPECRCNAGYVGDRCELNSCLGYCSNNGTCTLNADCEPVCACIDDYAGDRCEVADCLNYCFQGECSLNGEGLPECRCNAGYTGARCEVNSCLGYCLNNGSCSMNEESEAFCECLDDYAGDRCELNNANSFLNEVDGSACQCSREDKNSTQLTTRTYYPALSNITLADLFANWRKPVAIIPVFVVEAKP